MEKIQGIIAEEFLSAEINFTLRLPEYCEDKEMRLVEVINEVEVSILNFSLLLNSRKNIITTEDGLVSYTGPILNPEVDTTIICQFKIEKDDVVDFKERAFILNVD